MIRLDYRDARPIYEQVKDGLRHLMVCGAIAPGEKLPSVRALAASLAINPNTIQRAYEALEQEGYLQAVPGKGCFAARREAVDQQRRVQLLTIFDRTAAELFFLGATAEELCQRLRQSVPTGKEAAQ
ncbi:GntR family transcriptional regulator [Pseudoflavonifractor phocaeensis]|uniref:GntR family transcriptional regulator n=1 Tax=Pseudoflavonifractor phocaeensis TaxID=1870988 RepID=UPI001957BB94|nr:GntR family transcriptional regulator [Pseudoflavonifractor phocaeensis]MBM6870451.1 GntR family transcriptional regulator [Pseudoflavonifractor phocaeensis]MBM6937572.1 GntR family transcriptional regulator [Pseudoflavonifractor phocaeensis]